MSEANPPTQPPGGDPLRPTAEQKRVQETVMLDKQGLADLTAQAKAAAGQPSAPESTAAVSRAPAPGPGSAPTPPAGGGAGRLVLLAVGLIAVIVIVVVVGLALRG